jgi:hypothetical protein
VRNRLEAAATCLKWDFYTAGSSWEDNRNGVIAVEIDRNLRAALLLWLERAASGEVVLEDVFDWVTRGDMDFPDHGFAQAVDWLIINYGSDDYDAGTTVTKKFAETDEFSELVRFLRSTDSHFHLR